MGSCFNFERNHALNSYAKSGISLTLGANNSILAKVDEERYLIQDLQQGRPVILSKEEFADRYSGVLILVASRASILGSLAKFDFTWFIPAVIKYRRIFMEVLAVSVVIQLFALITPIWLCRIKEHTLTSMVIAM